MKDRERKNCLLFGENITELYQASALVGDRGGGVHALSYEGLRSAESRRGTRTTLNHGKT